jgi:hypothetical protein
VLLSCNDKKRQGGLYLVSGFGPRLAFWVNTLLNDFNLDSYAEQMKKDGRDRQNALYLGTFAYIGLRNSDGSTKPALEVWDSFRNQ